MKLNLGCGTYRKEGFINIDIDKDCSPDLVLNLGRDTLPYPNDSVDHVISNHFLEHITRDESDHLMKELYRVCKSGAIIEFCCPQCCP